MDKFTDPYRLLKVQHSANERELKQAYKRALLLNHPDKVQTGTTSVLSIDSINQAYIQIKHNMRQAGSSNSGTTQYPNSTPNLDASPDFSEIVDLGLMEEHEEHGQFQWTRKCRCGSEFKLYEVDLESNDDADEIAVQCTDCSIWILVQYSVE